MDVFVPKMMKAFPFLGLALVLPAVEGCGSQEPPAALPAAAPAGE